MKLLLAAIAQRLLSSRFPALRPTAPALLAAAAGRDSVAVEMLESRALLSGDFASAFRLGGDATPGSDFGVATANFGDGSIVAFQFQGTVNIDRATTPVLLTAAAGQQPIGLAYYTRTNELRWSGIIGGSSEIRLTSIAIPGSAVYLAGTFRGTADLNPGLAALTFTSAAGGTGLSSFIIKLDGNGNLLWARVFTGTADNQITALATDQSFNVYAVGVFRGTLDFNPGIADVSFTSGGATTLTSGTVLSGNGFVLKLDTSGDFVWAAPLTGNGYSAVSAIAVNSIGIVAITGQFGGVTDFDPSGVINARTSAGNLDAFVATFSSTGALNWALRFGSAGGLLDSDGQSEETGTAIAFAPDSTLVIAGRFFGTVDFNPSATIFNLTADGASDAFALKLLSDGSFSWAKKFGGSAGSAGYQSADKLTVDAAGNIYLAGAFSKSFDADPGIGTVTLTSAAASRDIFVLRLSSAGVFSWAKRIGGSSTESVAGLTIDNRGTLQIVGTFTGVVDFNPGTGIFNQTASGTTDAFILQLQQVGAAFVTVRFDTSAALLTEGGAAVNVTISRTGSTLAALTVTLTRTGVATFGTAAAGDFNITPAGGSPLGTLVFTIPAGLSSATFAFSARDDGAAEPTETATLTIAPSSAYTPDPDIDFRTLPLSIVDTSPVLSLSTADSSAGETEAGATPNTARVVLTLSALFGTPLDVPLIFTGTALRTGALADYTLSFTNGATFNAATSRLTVPIGVTTVQVTITPIDDARVELAETIIVTLGASPTARYNLAESASARTAALTFADDEPILLLSTTDASLSEVGTNSGTFTINRIGSDAFALTVPLTFAGTALRTGSLADYTVSVTGGSSFNAATSTLTIPVGMASVQIIITPIDDARNEGDETVTLTIRPSAAAYRLSTDLSTVSATLILFDSEPTIGLGMGDVTSGESAADAAANPGTFVINRLTDTSAQLAVNFTISGTALRGVLASSDYSLRVDGVTLTGNTVTIPAGASAVTITVVPNDDGIVEPLETVILSLAASPLYGFSLALPRTSTITIADNEPVISVSPTDDVAGERGSGESVDSGTFTIARTGSTLAALNVNFVISGSALRGVLATSDYRITVGGVLLTTSNVTIPAGASSIALVVVVNDDARVEPTELVTLTLAPSAPARYTIVSGNLRAATIVISDNEPLVTITTIDAQAQEITGGSTSQVQGTFRISRTGPTDRPLIVNISRTGTALLATTGAAGDFTITPSALTTAPTRITIPAGAETVDIIISASHDTLAEPTETVIISLGANAAAYSLGPADSRTATVSIIDDEPVLSISASEISASDENLGLVTGLGFNISRQMNPLLGKGAVTDGVTTVTFTLAGTAIRGVDYRLRAGGEVLLTSTVTIPDGASAIFITVEPLNDALAEGAETVIMRLAAGTTYTLSPIVASREAAFEIIDDEPVISVANLAGSGVIGEIDEAGLSSEAFVITRAAADTTADLVVRFTITGSATSGLDYSGFGGTQVTIPAGESSVELEIRPFADRLTEGTESIVLTLGTGSGYTIDPLAANRSSQINIANAANAGAADFGISTVTEPAGTYIIGVSSQIIRVGATISNTGGAASGPMIGTAYISTSRVGGAPRFRIGLPLNIASVAAGASLVISLPIDLSDATNFPDGRAPGDYYLIFELSGAGADASIINNTFTSLTNSIRLRNP